MGKGRVDILTKGEKKFMSDVYFVPGLKHNLISNGKFMQKGYNIFFKNDVCTILDKPPSRQLIEKVHMTNNIMFLVNIRSDMKEEGLIEAVTQENFQEEIKDEN